MVEQTNALDRRTFIAGTAAVAVAGVSLVSLDQENAFAVTAAEKKAEAEGALAKLKVLEEELATATDNYTDAKDSQTAAESKRDKAQKRIDKATSEISDLQDKLGTRARSMYRTGSTSFFDLLMGATSFQAFATNWEILNEMNESDAEMVDKTKKLRNEVTAQKEVYSEQAEKAKTEAKNASNVMNKAENLVAEMQATYDNLTEEAKELYKKEAAEREKQAALAEQTSSGNNGGSGNTNGGTTTTFTPKDTPSSNDDDDSSDDDSTSSKPSSTGSSQPTAGGNSIVSRAVSQLGVRYSYGAGMPGVALDCSGLVGYAVTGRSGHALGGTGSIIGLTRVKNPRPGDICVVHNSKRQHCGIYVSPGTMIHAPHTGAVVSYGSITSDMVYVRA